MHMAGWTRFLICGKLSFQWICLKILSTLEKREKAKPFSFNVCECHKVKRKKKKNVHAYYNQDSCILPLPVIT